MLAVRLGRTTRQCPSIGDRTAWIGGFDRCLGGLASTASSGGSPPSAARSSSCHPSLLSVGAAVATAADTGAKAPGGTAAPNGWTDASKAIASDDVYATARGDNVDQGYDGFGIDLPNGSIVDGISVAVEAKSSDASGCQLQVALSSGGSASPRTRRKRSATADSDARVRRRDRHWGRVWDPTQIRRSSRPPRAAQRSRSGCNDDGGDTATASVDYLTVTVTYRTVKGGDDEPALSKGVCNQADFAFVIDMSGSIGPQDGRSLEPAAAQGRASPPSSTRSARRRRRPLLRHAVQRHQRIGDDERLRLRRAPSRPTSTALSGPTGTTPTAAGINTGADERQRRPRRRPERHVRRDRRLAERPGRRRSAIRRPGSRRRTRPSTPLTTRARRRLRRQGHLPEHRRRPRRHHAAVLGRRRRRVGQEGHAGDRRRLVPRRRLQELRRRPVRGHQVRAAAHGHT